MSFFFIFPVTQAYIDEARSWVSGDFDPLWQQHLTINYDRFVSMENRFHIRETSTSEASALHPTKDMTLAEFREMTAGLLPNSLPVYQKTYARKKRLPGQQYY